MSVRTDVINLTVNINGNEAQNNLNNLRKNAADIKFAMDGLKKGTQEYIDKSKELKQVTSEMDALKTQIGITSLTLKELNAERAKLTAQRNSAIPLSAEFKDYDKQLQAVIARHKELTGGMQAVQSQGQILQGGFKALGTQLLQYLGIYAAVDTVVNFFKGSIDASNKAEQAVTQLKNTLQNALRPDLFDKMSASAEMFAEKFKAINANDIKNVFIKLIDYGKLTEQGINSLTEVIINYARVNNMSLEDATDVMTRAMEGNVRGLKTYGINIKDAHTVTERFGLIVNDLGEKLKNAEAVFENTNRGVFEVFKEKIVRMKEAVGDFLFNFLNALKQLPEWIDKNSSALQLLLVGVILLRKAYILSAIDIINETAAKIVNAIATKAIAVANNIAIGSQAAYIVISNLLTRSITLATAAQRLWNIATGIGAGLVGGIIIAIGIAVVAFNSLIGKNKELTAAQKANAEVQQRVAEATAEQKAKFELLVKVVQDNTVALDNRKKALQTLIAINPEYLGGLTLENIKTAEGTKLLNAYVKQLMQKAEMEAKNEVLTEKLIAKQKAFVALKSDVPGLAGKTDAELEQWFRDAEKQGQRGLFAGDTKFQGINISEVVQTIDQVKVLSADMTAAAKKNVTDGIVGVNTLVEGSVGARKKTLQDAIANLKTGYDKLNEEDKNGQKANLDQQKKYNDELNALEGKPEKTDAKTKYEELLKQATEFNKKFADLKFQSEESDKNKDQKEIDALHKKYGDFLKEYLAFAAKLKCTKINVGFTTADINSAEAKDMQALQDKQAKEKFETEQKTIKDNLSKSYAEQQQQSALFYEDEKNKQAQRFVAGEIDQKTYEANIAHIDVESKAAQLANAEEFAKQTVTIDGKVVTAVEGAAKDVTKFKKEELDKQTRDLIAAHAAQEAERKLIEDLDKKAALAKIDTKIVTAKSNGDAKAEFDAEKEKLTLLRQQKLDALDKEKADALKAIQETGDARKALELKIANDIKDQKDAVDAQYVADQKALDQAALMAKIDKISAYAQAFTDGLSSLNQIITNSENRQLQRDKKVNDDKLINLKKQLDGKLLSQAQYDKKVQAVNDLQAKETLDANIKQAKRDKELAIFQAIINTAEAVAKAIALSPETFGLPWSAIDAVLGGIQVAAIASAPLPVAAEGDWYTKGKTHKQGGIPVVIEKDEAVMKAAAMTDPSVVSATGTTAQITAALNSRKGGVNWAGGATIVDRKSTRLN